ncbi:MAG: S9 family peptidase [Bacillota bacterium]
MTPRPLTTCDFFTFTPLGEPQLDPAGTTVAFVRQRTDLKENSVSTEIWTVPVTGGSPRQLTAPGHRDISPRWSPDGSRLAFMSNRTGKNQLYLINPHGGEANLIATAKEPVSPFAWSPDGKTIAFIAAVEDTPTPPFYPGAPVDSAVPPLPDSRGLESEIKVIKTAHHKLDGMGFFGNRFNHVFLVNAQDTRPGQEAETRQLTTGRFNYDALDWSPDGQYLACVANLDIPDDDPIWVRHLYVIEVATGKVSRVLDGDYPVYSPTWSVDGTRLAFIGLDQEFDWGCSPSNLLVVDWNPAALPRPAGDARNLTGALDRGVGTAAGSEVRYYGKQTWGPALWSADGKSIIVVVAGEGESHLWQVAVDGSEKPRQLTRGERRVVAAPSLARDGRLAYMAGTATDPDEVFTLPAGGEEQQLTNLQGPVAAEFTLSTPLHLRYQAPDGWDMEGWMLLPAGHVPGQKHPAVLCIHGGPSGMYGYGFSLEFQFLASRGLAVVYVNPRGSSGYGARFSSAVVGDWGGRDYLDIMAGLDCAVATGALDPERLGVTGWSYGGFMTCWVVTQTDRFKAAIAGACVSNQVSMYGTSDIGRDFTDFHLKGQPWNDPDRLWRFSPLSGMGRVTTPMLLLHGENDLRCPVSQSEEVFAALERQGKTCVMVRYPGEPHVLTQPRHQLDRLERLAAWFEHYLGE